MLAASDIGSEDAIVGSKAKVGDDRRWPLAIEETEQQLLYFDGCEREERAQESAPATESGSGASLAEGRLRSLLCWCSDDAKDDLHRRGEASGRMATEMEAGGVSE
ncbi:hypothetical protein BHM03_00045824 [Ensete ventricosum]|nr:hypothetical protein BHM03_00045824 [Ensete ventricosum]